jgi:3-methyladenine DNA glycosylase/8-oxoguanine DNA glycosylase
MDVLIAHLCHDKTNQSPKLWCYNNLVKTRIQNESDIQFGLDELVKLDPALSPLIEKVEQVPLRLSENGYAGLAKIVTSRLISRAAAQAIWLRIENELGDVTPKNISCKNEQDLKDLGLSGAKARTFILLAHEVSNGTLSFDEIDHLPPDKALKNLCLSRVSVVGRQRSISCFVVVMQTFSLPEISRFARRQVMLFGVVSAPMNNN